MSSDSGKGGSKGSGGATPGKSGKSGRDDNDSAGGGVNLGGMLSGRSSPMSPSARKTSKAPDVPERQSLSGGISAGGPRKPDSQVSAAKIIGSAGKSAGAAGALGSAKSAVGAALPKGLTGGADLLKKAKSFNESSTGSTGNDTSAEDKAKEAGLDALKGAASGALKGAAGGVAGAAAGAAKGAGMALAKNKNVRIVLAAVLAAVVIIPAAAVVMLVVLMSGMSAGYDSAERATSQQSVLDSGNDEEYVAVAQDLASGSDIPWQIIAAIMRENSDKKGEDIDIVGLETAVQTVDPGSEYRRLAAGTYYVPNGKNRLVGTTEDETAAAAKVKETWSKALQTAEGYGEKDANRVYDVALSWYLGHSFGQCDFLAEDEAMAGQPTMELDSEQRDVAEEIIAKAKYVFESKAAVTHAAETAFIVSIHRAELRQLNFDVEGADQRGIFAAGPEVIPVTDTMDQRHLGTWSLGWFYRQLNAIEGWQDMAPGALGDLVMGTTDVVTYTTWEAFAHKTVLTNYSHLQSQPIAESMSFDPIEKDIADADVEGIEPQACPGAGLILLGDTVPPVFRTDYTISSEYQIRIHPITFVLKMHSGIDMSSMSCGEPIYSVEAGTVVSAVNSASTWGGGTTVVIDHANGFRTTYMHMIYGSPMVGQGDTVKAGQQIGKLGNTGGSTGCHLHFETKVDGSSIDPRIPMGLRGVIFNP